jgi:hypothetical protein
MGNRIKIIFIAFLAMGLASSFQKGKRKRNVAFPACVQRLITGFKKDPVQNPPRSIYRYTYHGKTVYYVPAPCCDFFSDLYDSACTLIAHPDGGFTGRGDGKAPGFMKERSNEKLLWKDNR